MRAHGVSFIYIKVISSHRLFADMPRAILTSASKDSSHLAVTIFRIIEYIGPKKGLDCSLKLNSMNILYRFAY